VPALAGQTLIDRVREMFQIPQPADADGRVETMPVCKTVRDRSTALTADRADRSEKPAPVGETEPAGGQWSELSHELRHCVGGAGPKWARMQAEGATNAEIMFVLNGLLPRSRTFIAPGLTGGKLGYTVQFSSSCPYLWLGTFKGPGHMADLKGDDFISRVRAVIGIPTPSAAAAKRAGKRKLDLAGEAGQTGPAVIGQ
jgi:hypothetical protein